MTAVDANSMSATPPPAIHPRWVRITHWINAVAVLVMIGSGWEIYNASPLFDFRFSRSITLGGWLAGALQWHFAAMWVLVVNGLVYLALGVISGRFRRKLLPIWPGEVLATVRDALRFKLGHDDITHYNAVQKLLYVGVIAVIIVQVASGFAVWKPIQLSELSTLFFGFQGSRLAHFIGMALIIGFLVVHVALALTVPKTIHAMLTGGPVVDDDKH